MSKNYMYFVTLIGLICAYFIVHLFFFTNLSTRTVQSDVVQGVLIGFGLAVVSSYIFARTISTKINGWVSIFGLGRPGNGMFLRAAHIQLFAGPVVVPEEAMYWWTNTDGAGHALNGEQRYIMHFPTGGFPPNKAFWSITMGDAKNHFVPNPINRYSMTDRSKLVANPDGSVDIYIQNTAPTEHQANWLPAPTDNFILWLRVYLPGQAILDGKWEVPPVVKIT
jgi:hypothetical protein